MAQVVTVASGDTINKILTRRGVKPHEIHTWLAKVRSANPHIGDLDRIWPGDRILLPDSLIEVVPEYQIWQNAFSHIPQGLRRPHVGNTALYFTTPGDTIDAVAQSMFANGNSQRLPPSAKRALLIKNNPVLAGYLMPKYLPAGLTLNITPVLLCDRDVHFWQGEGPLFGNWISQFDPNARGLFADTDPQTALNLAHIAEQLRAAGAAVGIDDRVDVTGALVSVADGGAASGLMSAATTNTLIRELYNDAVRNLGLKVVTSKKANHIQQVAAYFKSHPKYPQLNQQMRDLPRWVVTGAAKKSVPYRVDTITPQIARQMRKQYWLALSDQSSSRYMGTIASQLNGRVSLLKHAGRATTWYIPAALGLYNVAHAAPEVRMRTLFEEGFGVLGGAIGAKLGVGVGAWIAISVLGLGPFGLFVAVFICASAGGMLLGGGGKWFGGEAYDAGGILGNRIYYSVDELVGAFK
jgi:hypothetical protein